MSTRQSCTFSPDTSTSAQCGHLASLISIAVALSPRHKCPLDVVRLRHELTCSGRESVELFSPAAPPFRSIFWVYSSCVDLDFDFCTSFLNTGFLPNGLPFSVFRSISAPRHNKRDTTLWAPTSPPFLFFAKGFLAVVPTRKKNSDFRPNTYNIP